MSKFDLFVKELNKITENDPNFKEGEYILVQPNPVPNVLPFISKEDEDKLTPQSRDKYLTLRNRFKSGSL